MKWLIFLHLASFLFSSKSCLLYTSVKLFGQIRISVDDNGKEHSNIRILSSKLLKAKEQMKGQEEKKESVLGAIKKYQAEDKEKPKEKKEAAEKEAER